MLVCALPCAGKRRFYAGRLAHRALRAYLHLAGIFMALPTSFGMLLGRSALHSSRAS